MSTRDDNQAPFDWTPPTEGMPAAEHITPLSNYQPGQWWLRELADISVLAEPTADQVRAAKVAINFAAAVFASRSTLAAHTAREAEPVAWEPSGPLDANELERMAKSHPDKCFLKGSGVLKLLGAIRALEQSARAAPQPAALLKPVYQVYISYEGWNDIAEDDIASYESDGFSVRTLYEQPEGVCGS